MTNQGEIVYYDRALNNCLSKSGMHINHDLAVCKTLIRVKLGFRCH